MKTFSATFVLASLCLVASETPITKVVELLARFKSRIAAEEEEAKQSYEKYASSCKERSTVLGFDIRTGKSDTKRLKATIEVQESSAQALSAKIEELGDSIGRHREDLKAATALRQKEAADFSALEKQMLDVMSSLERSIHVLEKEAGEDRASMLQVSNVRGVVDALSTLVQASSLDVADSTRLTALIQSAQSDEDGSDDLNAPTAAAYESKSGVIVDTLEDLLDKAQSELADARRKETTSLNNFQLLKQSLQDESTSLSKQMDSAKKDLSLCSERESVAEGELGVISKNLADAIVALEDLTHDCKTKAQDFEAASKSRAEEAKAIAAAQNVVSEATGGAASLAYGSGGASFLQTRTKSAGQSNLRLSRTVRLVRDLARKHKSNALVQLASRMDAAVRSSGGSDADPFSKVKKMIESMVDRLEKEAGTEASHKAYCDKETADSEEKKADLSSDVQKLSTKIQQMKARSSKLKEHVAEAQKVIADILKSQAEMDQMRKEENSLYLKNKKDYELGVQGIQKALVLLRNYYATSDKDHDVSDDGSQGIVGLLEVVESDFSKGLAEITTTEESSAAAYVQETNDNKLDKVDKQKDVEFFTKEFVGLDKAVTEASSDRARLQSTLDAVLDYIKEVDDMCVAKPEAYEDRVKRRSDEIKGLQSALEILEGTASFAQLTRRTLRGAH
jgi:chromosome segregation ATPase|eukprot:TRINITY_DN55394_c0_g1_i1.p1 TRINITY_DN55394_c0_g1~~TRINITY_DN55394_c0_g1_i1.p1  ORF type:complete len:680 (-),score=177.71 TRINITY_DN55394_c0_g1_i1:88-2127(-)